MGKLISLVRTDDISLGRGNGLGRSMCKLKISGEIQQASFMQGVTQKEIVEELDWEQPQLSEILGGGDYSIENLLDVLDVLGLQLSVTPKK